MGICGESYERMHWFRYFARHLTRRINHFYNRFCTEVKAMKTLVVMQCRFTGKWQVWDSVKRPFPRLIREYATKQAAVRKAQAKS